MTSRPAVQFKINFDLPTNLSHTQPSSAPSDLSAVCAITSRPFAVVPSQSWSCSSRPTRILNPGCATSSACRWAPDWCSRHPTSGRAQRRSTATSSTSTIGRWAPSSSTASRCVAAAAAALPSTSSPTSRARIARSSSAPWRVAVRWCSGRVRERASSHGRACARLRRAPLASRISPSSSTPMNPTATISPTSQ